MAKVIFIQDILYEYFGVMYMSAYLKKHGHQCDVLIEYADKNWITKLIEHNPDVVAFSVLTGSFKWAVSKAAQIKKVMSKPIFFGGVHVFLNPDKTMKHQVIDAICTGEGEIPLKEVCDAIDRNESFDHIHGFWFRTPDGSIKKNPQAKLMDNLNLIEFADRSIYWKYKAIRNRTTLPLLGSRGCPYTCTYCFIPAAKKIFEGQGKFIRERSADNIIEEIRQCSELAPQKKLIHFVDDHFGNNRILYLKVFQSLSKINGGRLKWGGAIRVERFNKEEYVRELSKTNHALLGIAVECGDEDYRREVLKRGVKNEEIIQAAALARKYGMRFVTLNMVGLPGESFEQALKTLELNLLIKPEYANCYIYQPYPGTELQKYALEH
ncbi:MAG TPA: radical SAM protein, partial [Chitinophagales bacterium]|nr:radical SAM protein [Chitinophagales bacterium]